MTETDKNTLPQELKEWIENEAENYSGDVGQVNPFYSKSRLQHFKIAYSDGAAALYAHLKPLIDEKDAESAYWELEAKSKYSQVIELEYLLDAKDEEIKYWKNQAGADNDTLRGDGFGPL